MSNAADPMTAAATPPPPVVRCGVLGDPIEHSLSPVLHRAAFAALGLDWAYDAHRVPSGSLADFLAQCAAPAEGHDRWRGVSMTMPLKREAVGLLSHVTERGRAAGAVNTILFEADGYHGDNTDIPGAVAALAERGVDRVGTATILGGGATATSTGLALLEMGCTVVDILVRDTARAGETVQVLSQHASAPTVRVGLLSETPVRGDLVVSTVPASAQDEALVARCAAVPAVFEVLYDPWPTPLAAAAREDGRPLVSGFDLLVHQAAVQCALFTGVDAVDVPVAAMRAAGEHALAVRSSTT